MRLFLFAGTLVALAGCAPPGYENAAFTSVRWPGSDAPLTVEQRAEIEGRLRALGYLREPADAVITTGTRSAVKRYQGDIGAPVNGFVSGPLLDSLRLNTAYLSSDDVRSLTRTGQATSAPKRIQQSSPRRTPVRTQPQQSSSSSSGSGDSGGAGGDSGGGAWN